jgi:hypothetical protein
MTSDKAKNEASAKFPDIKGGIVEAKADATQKDRDYLLNMTLRVGVLVPAAVQSVEIYFLLHKGAEGELLS